MAKSGDLVMDKITANHAVREPLLIFLVDHSAVGEKVFFATREKFIERDVLFAAAAFCMASAYNAFRPRRHAVTAFGTELNFPYPDSAVTAVLFQHAGFSVCQMRRQFLPHLFDGLIQMRIAPPPEIAGSVKDFLGSQFQDDVGMCADKNTCGRQLAKHGIENRPVLPVLNRIDPYEDAVDLQQLIANFRAKIVTVNRGLRMYPLDGKCLEQVCKPVIFSCRACPGGVIARVDNRDACAGIVSHRVFLSVKSISCLRPRRVRCRFPGRIQPVQLKDTGLL